MTIQFAICGLEHSGTTLVSDLFRQVPDLDSGFEVGVLLTESIGDFEELQPFSDNLLEGWKISKPQLSEICESDGYEEFYKKLSSSSELIHNGTRIFDKTPRYLSTLSASLERAKVPFIVVYKDPRATVHSDFKRAKPSDLDSWYKNYMPGKRQYMQSCYSQFEKNKNNPMVHTVSLEALALNARDSMEEMFEFVGEDFNIDYLLLNGLRYKNTRSNAVSIPIAFSYLSDFTDDFCEKIQNDFSEFENWFYH